MLAEKKKTIPSDWELPNFDFHEYRPRKTRYALIVPVINEGERILAQLERMKPYMALADVILVDGGSTDGSIDPTALAQSGIRSLLIKKGPGRLSAQLRMGLAYILNEGYEGTLLVDGNNKDNPNAIARFIEELDKGYDNVQGSRFLDGGKEENTPPSRLFAIRYIHAPLISFASKNTKYTDTTNGFKAYSRKLLLDPRVRPFRKVFESYELHSYLAIRSAELGMKVKEIPVERVYPDSKHIPTKISKVRGSLLMLRVLFAACLHRYDP